MKRKLISMVLTMLFLVMVHSTLAEPGDPVNNMSGVETLGLNDSESFSILQRGSKGENVRILQSKLIELGILQAQADGIFGPLCEEAIKELERIMGWEETGTVEDIDQFNAILALNNGDGINLAVGTSSNWSDWMTPEPDEENICYTVAYAYLGDKMIGDAYTCQLEIEYADVLASQSKDAKAFGFRTQGQVDGGWEQRNIWNIELVKLDSVPNNGVYKYTSTVQINKDNINAKLFSLGFRCDGWAGGSFRVRNIKVEKGIKPTAWSVSEKDIGDGINLAVGTSSDWSEWITPAYNTMNYCVNPSYALLDNKEIGDAYTCQLEIEFSGVKAGTELGEGSFGFRTQGPVDDNWEKRNIWNIELIKLDEIPEDGVYQFTATVRISENNLDGKRFVLGFRCDNWGEGTFRIRNVKVEKGTQATEWSFSDLYNSPIGIN